jgi:hypothetical protein
VGGKWGRRKRKEKKEKQKEKEKEKRGKKGETLPSLPAKGTICYPS